MLTERNPQSQPEIWGGIECTINRVGDTFLDQFKYTGIYREPHLEAVPGLGLRKLRFPILWERHQPAQGVEIDWRWTRQQLAYFRQHNIDVIAGLVHHGSGPAFTNLLDDNFPQLLADYARKVITEFPWLNYFTPVNEPLTTARFSGLYGFWYPHKNDDKSFVRALLNQLKGTVLAMEEIRKVNPHAQLVQTEDLGKTYSTKKLKYQADFENERRWLTYDILCGKLVPGHKLWKYFIKKGGVTPEELSFFSSRPCIPDIFGYNYYVTSERFLDDDHTRYPRPLRGGNGKHRYADVEAFRVPMSEPTGAKHLIREAWNRYKRPIAITEVHLHSHREEQVRWFKYVYHAVQQLVTEGVDIRGITAWALFGSFGWNKLLTKPFGEYEPGVFDLRNGTLRQTALTKYIRSLTGADQYDDRPFFAINGWWERDVRLLYHPQESPTKYWDKEPPILIIGKRGTLGKAFAKICAHRALPYKTVGRNECDIADATMLAQVLDEIQPWAVVNAAGFVRVDDAESEAGNCHRDNCTGPENLARLCAERGIRLVSYSTDLVFDGSKGKPYVESDPVHPLNVYGSTKAASEKIVLSLFPGALVIRTSAFFGPWDQYNFLHWVEQNLAAGIPVRVAGDELVSPTYVPDLVHTTLDLLIDGESGIWHLANRGAITWADLAFKVARKRGYDTALIHVIPSVDMQHRATRPLYSVLGSERSIMMPALSNAIGRYFAEKQPIAELID